MSFQDLHHEFRIGRSTINEFVPEVLSALYACLSAKYLKIIINLQCDIDRHTMLKVAIRQFCLSVCQTRALSQHGLIVYFYINTI